MTNIFKWVIIFLFVSCAEEPPTIPPPPPPEPYQVCDLGEAKNCRIEENTGACQNGIRH